MNTIAKHSRGCHALNQLNSGASGDVSVTVDLVGSSVEMGSEGGEMVECKMLTNDDDPLRDVDESVDRGA